MEERRRSRGCLSKVNTLDDGCLMHIFSFLPPIPVLKGGLNIELHDKWGMVEENRVLIPFSGYDVFVDISIGGRLTTSFQLCIQSHKSAQPAVGSADRHNTALVCRRWRYLACHPHLWLRVEPCLKSPYEPGVFPDLQTAVSAARPGDTILIVAGREHAASNIQIKKPLCLIGGGDVPDDTILTCSRGADSAFEFLSTCKVTNLTVRAELGCCLLHRSGRLTIEGCVLQCETNPLDYLSCPIVTTAGGPGGLSSTVKGNGNSVTVSRTRIEGGAKAVITSGTLVLQRVRVICTRTALLFWFDVEHQ